MTDSLNPSSRVKGWVSFTTIFTRPASHPRFLAPRISCKAQMLSPIDFHFYLGQGHGGSRGWSLNTGMRRKHTMDGCKLSFRIIFIIVILIVKQFFLYLCMKERNRDPVRVFSCWLNVIYMLNLSFRTCLFVFLWLYHFGFYQLLQWALRSSHAHIVYCFP